jgi:hypothetical protein
MTFEHVEDEFYTDGLTISSQKVSRRPWTSLGFSIFHRAESLSKSDVRAWLEKMQPCAYAGQSEFGVRLLPATKDECSQLEQS